MIISGMRPNVKLLQALEKDSTVLEDQRRSFAVVSNKMRIVCVYEEIPMSIGIVREVATVSFHRSSPFPTDCTGGFSNP